MTDNCDDRDFMLKQILHDMKNENAMLHIMMEELQATVTNQNRVMQQNGLTVDNEMNNCVNSDNSTQIQQRPSSNKNCLSNGLVSDCDNDLDLASRFPIDKEMEYFLAHTDWDAEPDEDFFNLLGFEDLESDEVIMSSL